MNCHIIQNAKPLFILGPPRSGTTILSSILNSHPNVLMTNETAVFLCLGHLIDKSGEGPLRGMLFGKKYSDVWASHLKDEARYLLEGYYAKIAAIEKKDSLAYWGEKHPHNSAQLRLIESLFPEAMYIFTVRDPRDVICSIMTMNQWKFPRALGTVVQFTNAYENFLNSIPSTRLRLFEYEKMVDDYEGQISSLFAWLRLNFTNEVKDFLRAARDIDAHKPFTTATKDFKNESIGRWRRQLSAIEIEAANTFLAPTLSKYGYSEGGASEAAAVVERELGAAPELSPLYLEVITGGPVTGKTALLVRRVNTARSLGRHTVTFLSADSLSAQERSAILNAGVIASRLPQSSCKLDYLVSSSEAIEILRQVPEKTLVAIDSARSFREELAHECIVAAGRRVLILIADPSEAQRQIFEANGCRLTVLSGACSQCGSPVQRSELMLPSYYQTSS